MATQDGTLRAFSIEQNLPAGECIKLQEDFKAKYESTVARARLLKLSSAQNDHEHDIANDAKFENNVVFCSLMRLDLDSNARNVPDDLLNENSFPFDFLHSDAARSNIYKKHFYFCFNNRFVITTLPGNRTIGAFQTYINWLLASVDNPYVFNPLLRSNNIAKLSDIKKVIFNSSPVISQTSDNVSSTDNDASTQSRIISIGLEAIRFILNDANSLSDDELSQVVSAKLMLDIKRPKNMQEEEYQRKYGAIMKPVADGDNVQYELKNGKKIKSREMEVTKPVKIELTDKGNFEEEQLRQNMIAFLREVDNDGQT